MNAYDDPEPEPVLPIRPSIKSNGRVMSTTRLDSPRASRYEVEEPDSPGRPAFLRSQTSLSAVERYDSRRDLTPSSAATHGASTWIRKTSQPPPPENMGMLRTGLRPTNGTPRRASAIGNVFSDDASDSGSPPNSYRERSISPDSSHSSNASRNGGYVMQNSRGNKGPPPPPPARNKKPAPPPPPMKRVDMAATRY